MPSRTFDERLSYHARRFEGKKPQNVLKRYEQRFHVALKSDELQKHAFHVAAWVAELPAEQVCLQYDGLSAVSLLQQYVQSFKQAKPLGEHLTKVLTKVFARIRSDSELEMQCRGLLNDIGHFIPEAKKGIKAARLMNKAILVWRNTTCEKDQEAYVSSLEQSLEGVGTDDLCQIRSIFRRAVAALSPPRCAVEHAGGTADALSQPGAARRDVQFRLRKVVLTCLGRLDLDDSKVQPALQFLISILNKFQELDTEPHQIGCQKQWRLLIVKCGMSFASIEEDSVRPQARTKQKRILCPHQKRRDMCRLCHPCPHGKTRHFCRMCHPCPHGKLKTHCEKCTPCPHGKNKRNCRKCTACEHGKSKYHCLVCNACSHGRNKYRCKLCKQKPEEKEVCLVLRPASCSGNTL